MRPGQAQRVPACDRRRRRDALIAALLFGLTLLAYLPCLRGTRLWDDDGHITKLELRSPHGLARIWTEIGATQQYYPVLHTAFWVEHRLWGDAMLGYHLLNVVLHATAAWLLVVTLRRVWGVESENLTVCDSARPKGHPSESSLRDASRGRAIFALRASSATNLVAERVSVSSNDQAALLAGLIFALHPICVESVAWVSEQKNTLSAVFYLLAALTYLSFDAERKPARYLLATLFFILALLSKSVTATLPAALLVVFWWRRGTLSVKRDLRPLLPWFLLALLAGVLTAWVERAYIGAHGAVFELSWLQRGLLAGRIIGFYLGKLIWPFPLSFIYPRWTVDPAAGWQYLYPLGVGVLLAAGAWLARAGRRGMLAGALYFIGTLVPALGFFNVYPFRFSFVADHFQYLACLGVIVPAAMGARLAWERGAASRRILGAAGAAALLLVLGGLTRRQSRFYRDSETLYRATLAANPVCWMADNNLGVILAKRSGAEGDAVSFFREALRLNPDYPEAENNLSHALAEADAQFNRGNSLMRERRPAEAIPHYEAATRVRPEDVQAQNNLAVALSRVGRYDDALAHLRTALRLHPDSAVTRANLERLEVQAEQPAPR